MKVIDNRKKEETYGFGDVLKCWNEDLDCFDVYLIIYSPKEPGSTYAIGFAVLHDSNGNAQANWGSRYREINDGINALKAQYVHVEKVNAHLVIDDWCDGNE